MRPGREGPGIHRHSCERGDAQWEVLRGGPGARAREYPTIRTEAPLRS
jgi:hypothetical protein